ncbi:hypothetical protein Pst134EA_020773 [Puccinia striiformis f. sp. tritici]|uniref:hypothetical protein n=1 Tax=Puccinia striiformis f. sp. tritici TaxID=168172 RepID=UPI002008433F|nr:hypothetical protein Pst134EA_020773 [Puccinia striiformis f. sp. tritici]KAH9456863.1 hypothetical protein Pst134EA_020773 [Puccinia striiformis f. sp. tritici]
MTADPGHEDPSKNGRGPSFLGGRRPSFQQPRFQLGAIGRGPNGPQSFQARRPVPTSAGLRGRSPPPSTSRNPSFEGATGRSAETSHPYTRTNSLSARPESFRYQPAAGSSLPNRTSELRLRKPPCDQNEPVRSNEPLYGSQNDRVTNLRRTSAISRVQAPNSRETQVRKIPQTQYGAGDAQVRPMLAPPSGQAAQGTNNHEDSAERSGGEDSSHFNSREASESGDEYEHSDPRASRTVDTTSIPKISHPEVTNSSNQSSHHGRMSSSAARSSLASFPDFPIVQMEDGEYMEVRAADTGVSQNGAEGGQAAKSSKRSVPFSKPGSRKRQFISPSSSYLAHSSSKTQEEATSINDLLGAVGEKNRNLVEELDRAVRENQTLRAQVDMNEVEKRRSREHLKTLTTKVLSEKDKLDENFSDMKLQLRDRLELEKRQSEISSQEIGALRKEIRQSLEAFRSLHERSDIQEDEILEPNCLVHLSFQDARKAIGVAKEVDEDRKKKQMVIDILRKELESKSGQVTEMSQRIFELESLSGHQSLHMSQIEESWQEKSHKIEKTVEKRTELILGRLDEKYCLEEEKLHARIEVLENQITSKSQGFTELSKELEAVKQKLEHTERSLSTEHQNNVKNRQEWSRLNNELSRTESKRCILEGTASRLEKENSKLEESKSKVDADNISLRYQCNALSEDLRVHKSHLDQAQQDTKSLKSRLRDQQSVILELQARETVNEANKVQLSELKEQINQLEEKNVALETEKACMNLHLSECHLKIENLESKQKETIRISTEDSHLAKQLFQDALELKEVIRKIEATLDDAKKENLALRKDISVKEEELITAAGSEVQLKGKLNTLAEAAERQDKERQELQTRFEYTQSKWEDARSRVDLMTGQAEVLEEQLKESKEIQYCLNREIKQLQDKVANLMVKNSEVEIVGELRQSNDAIQRLSETVNQQIHKREEFDQLLKERLESEVRAANMFDEIKRLECLLEQLGKDNTNLQARLHTTQDELDHSKAKVGDLEASHAVQVSTTEGILHETERRVSESRKEAASAAREKAVATMERKYEVILMNANNEKKRLAKQLGDSESRLLAMSAELAKSKGKPSLEEVFSSSDHNEQISRPLPIKKRSETIVGLIDSEILEDQSEKQRALPEDELAEIQDEFNSDENDFKDHKRDHQEKVIGITQKTVMTSKVKSQPKCEEGVSKAEVAPKSSRRTAMPVTRSTKKAGVKKQSKRS